MTTPTNSISLSDHQLARGQRGNKPLLDRFIINNYDAIQGVARGTVRNRAPVQDHDDIAQEVFRRLLDPSCRRYDPARGSWKAYVRSLAFDSLDHRGRQRRAARKVLAGADHEGGSTFDLVGSREGVNTPAGIQAAHASVEQRATAQIALERVLEDEDEDGKVILLGIASGVDQKDLAERLRLSRPTVSRRVKALREKVRSNVA
jgi:RNA polymerase sigma factor (sigma-70 family)